MNEYRLYHGDCLKIIPTLNTTVDLVLTDLPYGVTDAKWDIQIPFEKMWDALGNIAHDKTTFAFFGIEAFSSKLKQSQMDKYKYDWYWIKSKHAGFLHSHNKPLTNVETISIFSNGKVAHKNSPNRMTYNPQGLIQINKTEKQRNPKKGYSKIYNTSSFKNKTYIQKYKNYPTQTLQFKTVPNPQHPSQKPVELLEYLIQTYSNKNETILDSQWEVEVQV